MHALNGWLKTVRADGLVLVRTRVAGPWGYAMEKSRDDVVFHFVAEALAFVRYPDAEKWSCRLVNWSCFRVAAHMKWRIRRGAKPYHGERSWLSVMVSSTATQRPSR